MSSADTTEATTVVPHGAYEQPSRYQITQHNYAANMVAYIELLEIVDPPDGRCGTVIHKYYADDSWFIEWEDLAQAQAAFKRCWGAGHLMVKRLLEQPGFKRMILCKAHTPWFYATGDQELEGDFIKEG